MVVSATANDGPQVETGLSIDSFPACT